MYSTGVFIQEIHEWHIFRVFLLSKFQILVLPYENKKRAGHQVHKQIYTTAQWLLMTDKKLTKYPELLEFYIMEGTHSNADIHTLTVFSQAFSRQNLFPDKTIKRLSGPANGIISNGG